MANGWEAIVDEVLALQDVPGDWRPGPSVQWFYKQWLGDSAVMVMSMTARGCHHHLIMMACQESPPCSIPDDELVLRGWCQHPADWPELWAQIRRAWRLRAGRWWQIGLCRSYLEAMRLRVVRRGVGGKGGRPKAIAFDGSGTGARGDVDGNGAEQKVVLEEPTGSPQKAIALNGKPIATKPTSSSSASASASASASSSEKNVYVARDAEAELAALVAIWPPERVPSIFTAQRAYAHALPLLPPIDELLAEVRRQSKSRDWKRGVLPRLDRWLEERRWTASKATKQAAPATDAAATRRRLVAEHGEAWVREHGGIYAEPIGEPK